MSAKPVQLRGRREVEHVLSLSHVRYVHARDFLKTLLHRADRVAVEVRGPLFELGEILHGPQAALRSMDLLIEHAPQTHRVQPESPVLRSNVGAQMELARGVT